MKGIKKLNNILVAYEPIWSIGTGLIPNNSELLKNIRELAQIKAINGFLVGGASLNSKKFIDIIKKTIN